MQRRNFLSLSSFGLTAFTLPKLNFPLINGPVKKPIVIATWDAGIAANKAAWLILKNNGRALDAVEKGVMVIESSISCCVGLGANPDRDGYVTLDASIMDENYNCGAVACLQRIKHPISVARRVMEKTPHVLLVGEGAQQFAIAEGFALEPEKLSPEAKKAYENWLKKSEYKPIINIERTEGGNAYTPTLVPSKLANGEWNHDTIAMLALDSAGNLSGSCTTSGQAFKMHGRVGDSPLIGAGLYVDNEVGAAAATGQGEDIIRTSGSHTVVELMRQGWSPEQACKMAVERIAKIKGAKAKDIQIGFIALNKQGVYGAYGLQKGFNYAICYADDKNILEDAKYLLPA
ncbi:N(4)-(beta-N-acetylglucosaminyl)-L-asparaginase [Hydrotalea sp.]|uniref:N(4)-(beta-N-acetylglucosaminyl)-L-asparaginase n=1 Tax=Hydrotalea sp. TaxID=2881279 RepID=UPI003D0F6779